VLLELREVGFEVSHISQFGTGSWLSGQGRLDSHALPEHVFDQPAVVEPPGLVVAGQFSLERTGSRGKELLLDQGDLGIGVAMEQLRERCGQPALHGFQVTGFRWQFEGDQVTSRLAQQFEGVDTIVFDPVQAVLLA
jgi:hypothetical protein